MINNSYKLINNYFEMSSTLIEKIQFLANGKAFNLKRNDYIFERILIKSKKFLVYDTQSRTKPLYTIPEEKFEEEWVHSTVIRLTKLHNSEQQIQSLFDQFQVRKQIDYNACPYLLTFYDQGIFEYNQNIYYAVRYDDPCRDFEHFISFDHKGLTIEVLDVFRLAKGCLEAFAYLEENGFILTQFDEKNLYAGSFAEDRGNFFRIMFKGHKDQDTPITTLQRRHKFSSPETKSDNIYKSYCFSVGLIMLYAILQTNGFGDEFPNNVYDDTSKIDELIEKAVDLCYKEGDEKQQKNKGLLKVFLEDLLEVDVEKRRTPREFLQYEFIIEADKLDFEEYQKELLENEEAKRREEEEKKKLEKQIEEGEEDEDEDEDEDKTSLNELELIMTHFLENLLPLKNLMLKDL